MLFDNVKITVRSGDGGNGAVSFRREKYVSHGGPDGGDGGHGGDIIFVIDEGQNTLLYFKYHRKFVAANGENGKGSKCHGKNAPHLEIPVPPGTVIKDAASGKVLKDMSDLDAVREGRYVLLHGGRGGFGNTHFATPTRQTPNFAKAGTKGREAEIELELKMLADAGLVGMPSAGKSTILSMVSAAKPKIAEYHFTTLSPILGVVDAKAGGYVLADIPGLIEGAADGEGLGHRFLRHVERCRLLVNVVDASGVEGRDPLEDIAVIDNELARYNERLSALPRILAANKTDMMSEETRARLEAYAKERDIPIVFLCAAIGEGTDELKELIARRLKDLPPLTVYEPETTLADIAAENAVGGEITVKNVNGTYVVEAERLVNVIDSINFNDYESMAFFQKVLRNAGVIDALEAKGVKDGDVVDVCGVEFEYYR